MKEDFKNEFIGGLNWDTQAQLLDSNNYEYALNAIDETHEGNIGALSTEHSNYYCVSLPPDYKIVGRTSSWKNNKREEILLLSKYDNSNSMIVSLDSANCTYSILLESPCLNLNIDTKCNVILKIKKNNERILYFIDKDNTYKVVNIDNLDIYKDNNNNYICDRFLFSPTIKPLKLDVSDVKETGNLDMGTYIFYARYVSADLSYTNIITNTGSVLIDKNSFNQSYFISDGGYNMTADGQLDSERYPKSSKSIELTLSNLDTDFKYVQIEIIGYTGGSGAITLVKKSELIPISNTSMKWVFTGDNVTDSSIDEIIIDRPIIYKVKAQSQKDNKLFIANIEEEKKLKYDIIQQAATFIKVKWQTSGVAKFDKSVKGNPKNNIEYKSFMRDEIYALGIQGILEKGDRTPVFHIPGRPAVVVPIYKVDVPYNRPIERMAPGYNWDKENFSPTSSWPGTNPEFQDHEIDHLTFPDANRPRWKLFNTAWIDNVIGVEDGTLSSPPFSLEGQMGYHESNELYPDIDTPNGLGKLYGSLTNTPIRHHRMPHTNLVPHVTNKYVYPLSLKIDLDVFINYLNAQYPELGLNTANPKIKKWVIVSAERTEDNKTILDKGITTQDEGQRSVNTLWNGGQSVESSNTGTGANKNSLVRFYSPKTLLKKSNLNPKYYQVENYNMFDFLAPTNNPYFSGKGNNAFHYYRQVPWPDNQYPDYIREIFDNTNSTSALPFTLTKRPSQFEIKSSSYVESATMVKEKETFIQGLIPDFFNSEATRNYAYTPHIYILQFNLDYGNIINNPLNANPPNDDVDKYDRKLLWTYGSLKSMVDPYTNLNNITYFEMPQQYSQSAPTVINYKGGDTFITPLAIEISAFTTPILQKTHHDMYYVWVESDINSGMRHSKNVYNKKDGDLYYKGWVSTGADNTTVTRFELSGNNGGYEEYIYQLAGVNWQQIAPIPGNMDLRCFKQALLYNVDYGHFYGVKGYFPLDRFYDFNNQSINSKFPYKIRYSETDIQENVLDNYRIFRPNNQITIDAQHGEIVDLFIDKSELYIRTKKTILFVPTNQQTIKTNETGIFLGKGDTIPYEPKPINNIETIYGGGNSFIERVSTEFGTILIDTSNFKIFNFREGLRDITDGMNSFFNEYFSFDFKKIGINHIADEIIPIYDSLKNRLILSVNIFKFNQLTNQRLKEGWTIRYDSTYSFPQLYTPSGVAYTLQTGLNDLGSKKQYTISYSFKKNKWISFHSYLPLNGFGIEKGYVTSIAVVENGLKVEHIYKHDIRSKSMDFPYLLFYNDKHKFIVDFSINQQPQYQKSLNNITIYSHNNKWEKLQVYTEHANNSVYGQHSGELLLIPKEQYDILKIDSSTTNGIGNDMNNLLKPIISSKEGYFNVDLIRDKVIDKSAPIFNINDKLNKVLNSANINSNFNMNQGLIKDQVIRIRLQFSLTNSLNTPLEKFQNIWLVNSNANIIQR